MKITLEVISTKKLPNDVKADILETLQIEAEEIGIKPPKLVSFKKIEGYVYEAIIDGPKKDLIQYMDFTTGSV